MIRSLRTGVSGLKSNQTRLDVVGNNISNANTVAFKRSRTAFSEMLGQQEGGGSAINPLQVGLGVSVGSIDQNWNQGSLDTTGVSTDLALRGDGFFVAQSGDRQLLTRAGNFTLNRNGELVTSGGANVQGWGFEADGSLATGTPVDIAIDLNAQAPAKFTETASVGGNLAAGTAAGGTASVSSVVYDEQGTAHDVVVEFTKDDGGTPSDPADDSPNLWDYTIRAADPAASPFAGPATGTVEFATNGRVTNVTGPSALTWAAGAVAGGPALNVDLEGLTQYDGSMTATVQEQDGYAPGSLTGYRVKADGVLEASFSNGEQQELYQLAIGNVNNPNGLKQEGENFYSVSSASGDLQLGQAGQDLPTSVVSGALESSNVDLATEFTEMIVAQRGYQASARVVTTSDELLQETMQLKR